MMKVQPIYLITTLPVVCTFNITRKGGLTLKKKCLIVLSLLIFLFLIFTIANYKTIISGIYQTRYKTQNDEFVTIKIPKLSMHYRTGGEFIAKFITLSSEKTIKSVMDDYLTRCTKMKKNNTSPVYYDDANDMIIENYNIIPNHSIFNEFHIYYYRDEHMDQYTIIDGDTN